MNPHFEIKDGMATLDIPGDLVNTSVESVRGASAEFLDPAKFPAGSCRTLQVNLAAAKMVDSVGLNLIVTLLKRARERNAQMEIIYSNANVLRTFAFTRLDRQMKMTKA
ncbi:MAG TPA: STAS domain-containing protein [Verrucomicrobiae bacterium]|nr:STAS domain-containing protein [Verrucomicrobiae bacterium]